MDGKKTGLAATELFAMDGKKNGPCGHGALCHGWQKKRALRPRSSLPWMAKKTGLAATELFAMDGKKNGPCGHGALCHGWQKKRALRPVFFQSVERAQPTGAPAASSSVTAFMDRRMRPCLSTSSTLTLTMSPSLSLSETFSTRSLEICETCTKPSLPGSIVTNAPKSISLATLPS